MVAPVWVAASICLGRAAERPADERHSPLVEGERRGPWAVGVRRTLGGAQRRTTAGRFNARTHARPSLDLWCRRVRRTLGR